MHRLSFLPTRVQRSGYFSAVAARALYDATDYEGACEVFQRMRRAEQWRMDSSYALYSSCLWQLRKDKLLAGLAQALIEMDRNSPTTLIVAGNAHSVVSEHDTALAFLKRANLADPHNAYPITLTGMEYLILGETDAAVEAFQDALSADSRDYGALFGLGQVHLKTENFQRAVQLLTKTAAINNNPRVALALSQAIQGKATDTYAVRNALQPVDALLRNQPDTRVVQEVMLRRAELCLLLNEDRSALEDLQSLIAIMPRDARVHFLLGRLYKRAQNSAQLALRHFNHAMELDPKLAGACKAEVEQMDMR
eukprot:Hpha_TRINITY_DN14961_c1_g1::TRINITY_DN14961_c1_g1_i1::g.143788::m.143788/K03350/APC3, CDC27; anaphase-promoting complex subunit 3